MTISSTTNRVSYTGDGTTTSFSFPYSVIAAADLKVYQNGTLKTLTTHYTLSGSAPYTSGTNVQFVSAPADDDEIVIYRDPAITQTVDLVENDPLPVETAVERPLDKLTQIAQRLSDRMDRAFHLADSDVSGASVVVPTPAANTFLAWDDDAEALINVDVDDLLTIGASANFITQTFSGDGSDTTFTLSATPGNVENLDVFVSGVRQTPTTDYTVSGTTLTFTTAPASGTNNILVKWGTLLAVGTLDSEQATFDPGVTGDVDWNVRDKLRSVTRHLKDFGATGDGSTDDTDALQAACAWLKAADVGGTYARQTWLDGEGGVYKVAESLDLTGMDTDGDRKNWGLRNIAIEGHCTGKTVLDLTDSRFGRFDNVHVSGDATNTPSIGILIARDSGGASAGEHKFINCGTNGHFSIAGFFNYASEVNTFIACDFWNQKAYASAAAPAYAAVFDGEGSATHSVTPTSDFQTLGTAAASFLHNTLVGCDFRKVTGGGPTIFLSRAQHFKMVDCYSATVDDYNVDLYVTGNERNIDLELHTESTGQIGAVKFRGAAAGNPGIRGFSFIDSSPQADDHIFGIADLTTVTLHDARIHIASITNTPLTDGIFQDESKFKIIGYVSAPATDMPLFSAFSTFHGIWKDASGTEFRYVGTHGVYSDDAGASAGPNYDLMRASASPAANDQLGQLRFRGKDSAGNDTNYAYLRGFISDPTDASEDGRLDFLMPIAGTDTVVLRLLGSTPFLLIDGSLKAVTVGAADSGGSGFKLLRVPN